jgi:hypothetical protein
MDRKPRHSHSHGHPHDSHHHGHHYRPDRSLPDAVVALLTFGGIVALIGSVILMRMWYS